MSKQKAVNKKRQYHTKEFKLSAVKMVLEEQLEATEVAGRIGVDAEDLKRWVKTEHQKKSSKDQESMKALILLNKKHEEEIRRLKMEREILKKAMAYFIPGQS
jgi:transposase